MHNEQHLYRMEWRQLRRHLYRLCLGTHQHLLLDGLCGCTTQEPSVPAAVDAWRQAILAELTRCARASDAWPGWGALLPLFGNTARLSRDLEAMAEAICHEYAAGGTSRVWKVLYAYFTDERDALDGGGSTRVRTWRRLDRLRRELTAQRRQQGGGEYGDLAELVADLLLVIEQRGMSQVPTTVEGLLAYFYAFDPAYTQPYEEELQGLDTLQELTDLGWFDLQRAFEALPDELRQALEIRLHLRPQPMSRHTVEQDASAGRSARTLRDRADRAIQRLRQALEL